MNVHKYLEHLHSSIAVLHKSNLLELKKVLPNDSHLLFKHACDKNMRLSAYSLDRCRHLSSICETTICKKKNNGKILTLSWK